MIKKRIAREGLFFVCCVVVFVISLIMIEKANYSDEIKNEKISRFSKYKDIDLKEKLKQISEKCGKGYAIGWWIGDENYLTYRNEELLGYKPVGLENRVFSIKKTAGNPFYLYPQQTDEASFDVFKSFAVDLKNPKISSCRNIRRCNETKQPIFLEMIIGSAKGYKNEQLIYKGLDDLRKQFDKLDYPIINLSYFFAKDKVEGIYHFFHISDLSVDIGNCEIVDGSVESVLKELAKGIN